MKEKSISKNDTLYKWYLLAWTNNKTMPTDTCTFYRKTIYSILLFPVTHLGYVYQLLFKERFKMSDKLLWTFFTYVIPYGIGTSWWNKEAYRSVAFWKIWLAGFGTLAVLIGTICLVVMGIMFIKEKIENRRMARIRNSKFLNPSLHEVEEKPSAFKLWIQQIKEKTCSKIVYTD
jgi:predicted membrane protein